METNTKWVLDPSHSEIVFKVKHLMIAHVKGEFKKFEIDLRSDGQDFSKATVLVNIDARSINTNDEGRDAHLKGPDFFDVEKHPDITFKGLSFVKHDEQNYQLKGLLSIKGISKEVSIELEFGGMTKDPWGNEKAGFSLSTKINRKDWGLSWNAGLETGGVLVSEEVKISAEIQFVKQV